MLLRGAMTTMLCAAMLLFGPRISRAQDASRELGHADFRVRVSAALAMGRNQPPGAREALVHALGDTHPGVRAAAAAALGALGDAAAIPALERTLEGESSGSTGAQMRSTIALLRKDAPPRIPSRIKYALRLGAMQNNTQVQEERIGSALRRAATTQAATLPGALLIEAN